tara:strand:- start:361 stop:606 length:246 start_codon:yes stop_codon:yes gene_type:complete
VVALPLHPFIPIQVVLMSAQAELALGFGQQPAQFKARIALQFLLLGAPPIREQFKAVVIPPSSEHQGSNPWTPIRANRCQL